VKVPKAGVDEKMNRDPSMKKNPTNTNNSNGINLLTAKISLARADCLTPIRFISVRTTTRLVMMEIRGAPDSAAGQK
jgi:hypothetical protein